MQPASVMVAAHYSADVADEIRLVGAAEIALLLGGISRTRVTQITSRADFPTPVAVLAMGKVWRHDHVVKWAQSRDRPTHPLPKA